LKHSREGAEKIADVSPTDGPSEAGSFADGFDAHFAGDDNQPEGSPEVGNQGAEQDGRERFIPRERFDRIHDELLQRKAWDPVIARISQAYGSPEAFFQAHLTTDDPRDAYDDEELAYDPEGEDAGYDDDVRTRNGLTDGDRMVLLGSRRAMLAAQRNNAYLHAQLRELALANARARLAEHLPDGMPRGIENMLRVFPVDLIPAAARDIHTAIAQAVESARSNAPDVNRIITEYNSRKAADRAMPTPETRGGDPPPTPFGGSEAWKQPFSKLLGWTGHTE
jgi:hypothetical protein